jgi:hypothetical protein
MADFNDEIIIWKLTLGVNIQLQPTSIENQMLVLDDTVPVCFLTL